LNVNGNIVANKVTVLHAPRPIVQKAVPDQDFRIAALAFIYARSQEFTGGEARRDAFLMRTFGTTSLTELSDADLAKVRKHILSWRRRP